MRRVLLDECVPRRLLRELQGLDGLVASHVRDEGWTGQRNGDLLRLLTAAGFDLLVTVDRNLSYQHNVGRTEISVIVLHAPTNRLADLLPLVPELTAAIAGAPTGRVTRIGA